MVLIIFKRILFLTLILSIIFEVNTKETLESLEINLKDGPVRGYYSKSYDNKSYIAFEGIPYAGSPIGDLRFKEPIAPTKWTTPLNANKTYICTQYLPVQLSIDGTIGQEDCLYINVYIPDQKLPLNLNSQKRDVVVHIHGGAFVLGAPKLMAGARYIMNEDVIYVSFNYRLGILGFLSTNDQSAPGNYGLKDQTFALEWIQQNIEQFGGNVNSITLTGHSAGSASVHYHVLSKKSKGLFHKAVMISGTALNPWAVTEDPLTKAQHLGDIYGCSSETNDVLVDCLRKIDGNVLVKGMKHFYKLGNVLPATPFGPVVEYDHEGAFITKSPFKILMDDDVGNYVPLIISFTKDEGIFPSGFMAFIGQINTIKTKWNQVMQYGLDFHDTMAVSDWSESLRLIKDYYYPQDDLNENNLTNLTLLWTHRFYLLAIEKAIRLHTKLSKHPVYVYYFNYDSPGFDVFPSTKGVAHCEDLQLMFKLPITPGELTEEDHEMSQFLIKILTNFARKSVPMDDWTPMKQPEDNSEELNLSVYEITSASGNKMATKIELAPTQFWNSLPIREEY